VSDDFYCDEVLCGRTPVEVVIETADVLAFRHTRPFWPVHIVIVPKRHVPSLIDLGDANEAVLHQVLAVVRRIAEQVTRETGACRVLTNLGSYQESKHLHFHVNAGEPLRSTSAPPSAAPQPAPAAAGMTLEELYGGFQLCDGKVQWVRVCHAASTVDVALLVRERAGATTDPVWVAIELSFSGVVEHGFNGDEMDITDNDYSDITFLRREDGRFYLSADPYGNSGVPHERDNDVVIADALTITLARHRAPRGTD